MDLSKLKEIFVSVYTSIPEGKEAELAQLPDLDNEELLVNSGIGDLDTLLSLIVEEYKDVKKIMGSREQEYMKFSLDSYKELNHPDKLFNHQGEKEEIEYISWRLRQIIESRTAEPFDFKDFL